ncbi:MAG: acylphosphatase [Candidatus Azambacteria bacterium]|nr:acylphosphatase [Candidatus Azambacteria bacterium]
MTHVDIKIFGEVQGVFFRHSARLKAREIGITGFVKNELDGAVYMEAEGDEKALGQFLEWCRHGPESAKVEKVESFPGNIKGFSDFIIK